MRIVAREGLKEDSDILINQIRALSKARIKEKIAKITSAEYDAIIQNLCKTSNRIERCSLAMLAYQPRIKISLYKRGVRKAGCERIYEDTISGTRAERPGLAKAFEMLRSEDVLVVWKLDRLGRSVKNLITLVEELNAKSIHFKSLTDSIDTSTPSGRFFFMSWQV